MSGDSLVELLIEGRERWRFKGGIDLLLEESGLGGVSGGETLLRKLCGIGDAFVEQEGERNVKL